MSVSLAPFDRATASAPYRTVRALAEGGMGRVELVVRTDGQFRRAYARKRLRPQLVDDEEARTMFVSEARIAGLLHHPNVVSVIDVGEDAEGPFLVMDYVQGMSLAQLLVASATAGEQLPVQIAVRVFLDVARGLAAAHELQDHGGVTLGLVHRDVSPQNVLIGYDGVARLSDFGIAKAEGIGERTSTGVLKGKFGYFAPEQLSFLPATTKTDLFSLGVVFYEALTQRRLYRSATHAETAQRIIGEAPPDPYAVRDDLHPDLVALVFRLLAKRPEDRPADAAAVATELEAILADLLMSEPPVTVKSYLAERFADRAEEERARIDAVTTRRETPPSLATPQRRWVVWALAAGVGLSLGAAGIAWSMRSEIVDDMPEPAASPDPPRTAPLTEQRVPEPPDDPVSPDDSAPTEDAQPDGDDEAASPSEPADPSTTPPTSRPTRTGRRAPRDTRPASGRATPDPSARPSSTVGDRLIGWGQ
ncbi:MAG: protein kinase [Sandaracinaceae bacterium]